MLGSVGLGEGGMVGGGVGRVKSDIAAEGSSRTNVDAMRCEVISRWMVCSNLSRDLSSYSDHIASTSPFCVAMQTSIYGHAD